MNEHVIRTKPPAERVMLPQHTHFGVFHLKATTKQAHSYENLATQARDMILPLSVLRNGSDGFSTWINEVATEVTTEKSDVIALLKQLQEIKTARINPIDEYRFPVVTLTDKASAEAAMADLTAKETPSFNPSFGTN